MTDDEKHEYEQLCERIAIEVQDFEPDVAQKAWEFRVAKERKDEQGNQIQRQKPKGW